MSESSIEVAVSAWTPAAFAVGDETVFAVGDIHGCARELKALLAAIAGAGTDPACRKRLIFLGDMIDRGPDTVGVLNLWAERAETRGVDRIDRLMGNHEQLLLLAIADHPDAEKAEAMWLSKRIGGDRFLDQMRALNLNRAAGVSAELLAATLGDGVFHLLGNMKSHVVIGNVLFVHAGLDPLADPDEFLARPWTSFTDARWAWIHGEFLEWQGGFNGRIVVHGHTPPKMHRELTGQADPHLLMFDRLGLDGGSAVTGIVTGAQIENGRYRILRAGTPAAIHGVDKKSPPSGFGPDGG
jgi:serine/threonine protein phosphatase 1